jgi:DNA-binding XRE family transcriptional regulator
MRGKSFHLRGQQVTPADLIAARAALGMTQTDLGAVLGLSKRQIIRLEKGDKPIRPIYADLVARLIREKGK